MPKSHTARQFYVVSNTKTPPAAPSRSFNKRPSGIGLVGAALVSLALWAGLIWLGVITMRAFTA